MAKQTAIEWLEAAGVDCSLLRAKLAKLKRDHTGRPAKDGRPAVAAALVPEVLLRAAVRSFVTGPGVEDALVQEIVDEFSGKGGE